MLVSRDVDSECNRSSRDASALWPSVRPEKHFDFEAFCCLVIVLLNPQTESHLYFTFCINKRFLLARFKQNAMPFCRK